MSEDAFQISLGENIAKWWPQNFFCENLPVVNGHGPLLVDW